MTGLDLIRERVELMFQVTAEALAHGARAHVDRRMVSTIDSIVGSRYELAAGGRDVVIEDASDSTLERSRDRLRRGLHTFRGYWRPSPARGVLVLDHDGQVTLQPNLPHETPNRVTVTLYRKIDAATYDSDDLTPAALGSAYDVTLVYTGIHRGSGLLVYRMLP